MSEFRKLLDMLSENTTAGSVAVVSQPLGGTQRRVKEEAEEVEESEKVEKSEDSESAKFKNAPKTETVAAASDYGSPKAPATEPESKDPQGTPVMPEVIEYGNWENSALVTTEKVKAKRSGKKSDGASVYTKKLDSVAKESKKKIKEGVKEDSDPCWDNYKQVGMKEKGGRQVPNCVPKEGVAEAFGPLPRKRQQIRLGRHTVDIERVGLDKNYISFAWNDSQGQEHYEEVAVGDLGSYDDLIKRIKQEISYQERQYTDQGVAEGSGFIDQMASAGHKIIANRKTPKGSYTVVQNKNDGKYEIHKLIPGGIGMNGFEFVSAHKTPQEMETALKALTGVAEGYYDLPNQGNIPGMEPIDFSSKPSFKDLITRYTQLVYQGHAGETSPEEDQEYDDIENYVAQRFGEKGSAHLEKAGQVSYWGRDDKPYGRDSRSSNLGRPNQPSGDFRTTKTGKMHGQDAKTMKSKVTGRLGRHPAPNLPEQSMAEGQEFGAYYHEKLAQQIADKQPDLSSEDQIIKAGYEIAKGEMGARARSVFRDDDFIADLVSSYSWLKKQNSSLDESSSSRTINDDDWYEIDADGNIVKQSGPSSYRPAFGVRIIKLANGNRVVRGMTGKTQGLFKGLSEATDLKSIPEGDTDKIAGRYDPEDFDAMVDRLGKLAKEQESRLGPVDIDKLAKLLHAREKTNESSLEEERMLAKELLKRAELFKRGRDKALGSKPADRAIQKKTVSLEDLDANQKRAGQLGPTEPVKNNNIGKLVGANESIGDIRRLAGLGKKEK
jgi:hypothetical protein